MAYPTPIGLQSFSDDYEIVQRKNSFYEQALTPTLAYWEQANTDTLYECGSAQLWSGVYGNLPAYARKTFNLNYIRPSVNMIAGHQMDHRKTTIVVPRSNGTQQTTDDLTKALDWQWDKEHVYEKISEAFRLGPLITGMSLIQIDMDYSQDPISGQLRYTVRPFNSFIIDPYWSKLDFSDCQGIIVRDFVSKRALISMYPQEEEFILNLPVNGYGNARDNKFQYTAQSYNYGIINLMTYDQYFYRDFRRQKKIVDVETGESHEFKGTEDYLRFILSTQPSLTVIECDIPTVKVACFIQDRCMYNGPTLGDFYPLVPFIGYYHPEIPYYEWRIQSVVRSMRDAQFLYTRFVINMCDVVESQVNSGWKYKENALVDPLDVFLNGQGKGLALKKDALMSDVEKIVPTEASNTAFKLADIFLNLRTIVSGVNEELLGANNTDMAGILSRLRQGAGLTTLKILFNNLDLSQKILGDRSLAIIKTNYVPSKMKRILGHEPSPYFYNQEFGEYECAVEDGFNTATQKQMQYAQLLEARRELGDEIPTKTIIDAMTIQNKDQLMKDIQERQQQKQQMEQAQMQSTMQLQQAQAELAQARSIADKGLGIERISRVQENQALAQERRAAAIKDEEDALLSKVKILKEIEGIDITHLQQLMAMLETLKTNPQSEQERPGQVNRGVDLAGPVEGQ